MPPPLPAASRALNFFAPPAYGTQATKSAASSSSQTAWELEAQRTRGRLRKGTRTEVRPWPGRVSPTAC